VHKSYQDITNRIEEEPTWWMNGVPRYCKFEPHLVSEWQALDALLVHVRCQSCKRDFHVALGDHRPWPELSYVGLLNTHSQLGVIGDPPNHECDGPGNSMTAEEVAVVEFWHRFTIPKGGHADWQRRPELERSLEEPDTAMEERHLEAWSRIRRFRSRREGLMGKWTPADIHGPAFPSPKSLVLSPPCLPSPHVERSPTTGKFIDTPRLNERRRLAMLALSGRITAEEFAELKERSQTEYRPYEERPSSSTPIWAEGLVEEVMLIDETVLANAIPGYREMPPEQREERYCPDIHRQLFELAVSGRITPEERKQVLENLVTHRLGPLR